MAPDSKLINDIKRHAYELRDHGRSQLLNIRESSATALDIIDELPDQVYKRLLNGKSFEFDPIEVYYDRNDISEDADVTVDNNLPEDLNTSTEDHHQDKWLQTLTSESRLEKRLDHIRNRANSNKEEKGYNNLFLSIGFLEYERITQPGETKVAPLFLIPVSIFKERGRGKKNELKSYSEECRSNNALRELLEDERYCSLPDLEEASTTPEAYLQEVKAWIAQNDLPFRVLRRARIDMLPYRNESIIMDLDPTEWGDQDISSHELIRSVLFGEGTSESGDLPEDYGDDHPIASRLQTPLPADPSQVACMIDAMEGKSLVIDGPPGTGKSQTIANMIALLIAQKKSVLFVAEKKVALDVVHERLSSIGLDSYTLSAHSENATSTSVLAHLNKRLSNCSLPEYSKSKFNKRVASLKREQQYISRYLDALHECHPVTGISTWDMMWRCSHLADKGSVSLNDMPEMAMPSSAEEFTHRLSLFQDLEDVFRTETDSQFDANSIQIWKDIDASGYMASDHERIQSLALRVRNAIESEGELTNVCKSLRITPEDLLDVESAKLGELVNFSIDTGSTKLKFDYLVTAKQAEHISSGLSKIQESLNSFDISWLSIGTKDVDELAASLTDSLPNDALSSSCDGVLRSIEHFGDAWERTQRLQENDAGAFTSTWVSIEETNAHIEAMRIVETLIARLGVTLDESMLSSPQLDTWTKAASDWCVLLESRCSLQHDFDFRRLPDAKSVSKLAVDARSAASRKLNILRPSWHKLKRQTALFTLNPKEAKALLRSGALLRLSDYMQDQEAWVRKYSSLQRVWPNTNAERQDSLDEFKDSLDHLKRLRDINLRFEIDIPKLVSNADNSNSGSSSGHVESTVQPLINWLSNDPLSPFRSSVPESKWKDIALYANTLSVVHSAIASLYKAIPDIKETTLSSVLNQAKLSQSIYRTIESINIDGLKYDTSLPATTSTATKICKFVLLVRNSTLPLQWQEALLSNTPLNEWSTTLPQLQRLKTGIDLCLEDCKSIEALLYKGCDDETPSSFSKLGRFHDLLIAVTEYGDQLSLWKQVSRIRNHAKSFMLYPWVDPVLSGERRPEMARYDYEYSVCQRLVNSQLNESSALGDANGGKLAAARSRYKDLTEELSHLSKYKYQYSAHLDAGSIAEGNTGRLVSDLTDRRLIQHYQSKSPRKRKLRWIFERAEKAIRQATPCVLMSPTSVAEVLPKKLGLFDVVIFDEASQLRPATAYGGILRANSAIIVGDPNQLPPTTFFSFGSNDETDLEDETVADGGESILDIAAANIGNNRRRRLKVHYRSEHESLIAFSNHHFYDDELTIFPSPTSSTNDIELGVSLKRVNGLFTNKGNLIEATAIVDAIVEHAKKYAEQKSPPSLGVATFNRHQADLIETVLYARTNEDPIAASNLAKFEAKSIAPIFIKNLERVQGDERDVIFISYTYGPPEPGARVAQNFGPINLDTGWRRLNVLVTRAKQQVRVFSSMNYGDISADVGRKGRIAMRNYLQYAHEGVLADHGKYTRREPDSDFEISVANALSNFGVEPVYQVGVSNYFVDIGVRLPGKDGFILGIECDGAPYHSSPTARMRDAIREEQIRRKGWNLYRIWSTDWYQNRKTAIKRLEKAVETARLAHIGKTSRMQTDETTK